jgi:hypothetical protein
MAYQVRAEEDAINLYAYMATFEAAADGAAEEATPTQ